MKLFFISHLNDPVRVSFEFYMAVSVGRKRGRVVFVVPRSSRWSGSVRVGVLMAFAASATVANVSTQSKIKKMAYIIF